MGGARVLLVGQAPSAGSDPAEPFSGRSGARLAKLCALSHADFLARFDRVNLIDKFPGWAGLKGDAFPAKEAREAAAAVMPTLGGRRVIFVGIGVAKAFKFAPPLFCWRWHEGALAVVSPHPSGANLWWNDAGNVARATAFWTGLVGAA